MSLNNTRISASELDFDAIKTNLKIFLSGQDQFTDYDFEGSSMSILLDVLAYNTHYRALYDNFILNEMFLDSASKRSNVVSRAKELGYTPVSIKSATAYINFTLSNAVNGPALFILPKFTPFTASINGVNYTFITLGTHSTTAVAGVYTINNIKLTQGSYMVNRIQVAAGVKYIIPNANVDTSTLTVMVQANSESNLYEAFTITDSLVGVGSDDKVFWIKEIEDGQYELEFGNGIIGKSLVNGNVVQIEYIISDGPVANSSKLFKYIGPDLYLGSVNVITVAQSSGATAIETIDSIKFNAPRIFSAQNRAVTVEDYQNLIYNLVPEAASVNVWSGADNIPPQYGKVFICIKPKTIERFTNIEKVAIKGDVIKSKNVVSVIPEIIDPQYIKVAVESTIYYNLNSTTKTLNDIKIAVQAAILDYNTSELQKFKGILRFSKLTRVIDDADPSIVSNVTNITLRRPVDPKFNTYANYNINLVNPVHLDVSGESFLTTGFYASDSDLVHYLADDGAANIILFTLSGGVKRIVNNKIGTIDYSRGLININGLYITAIVGDEFDFIIKPSSYDVVSVLDQLVYIPADLININVIPDQSIGASGGGANYTFTSSRS